MTESRAHSPRSLVRGLKGSQEVARPSESIMLKSPERREEVSLLQVIKYKQTNWCLLAFWKVLWVYPAV